MAVSHRRRHGRDVVAGVAALILAGLYWLGADDIPKSALIGDGIGADALPKALAGLLALLSVLLLVRGAIAWRAAALDEDHEEVREDWRRHLRAGGMLLIGVVFLWLLGHIGYVLSVFLLLSATAVYNGRPVDGKLLMFAAGLTLVFYLLFVKLLDIPLPTGFWPILFS